MRGIERDSEREKEISHVYDKFMMIVMRHQKHSLLYFDHSFISQADNKCYYMLNVKYTHLSHLLFLKKVVLWNMYNLILMYFCFHMLPVYRIPTIMIFLFYTSFLS